MWTEWWTAHRLEVYAEIGLIVVLLLVGLGVRISKRKK